MRTLSVAAIAVTMVTALHAEPLDNYLRGTLRTEDVSGPHDLTALIAGMPYDRCDPTPEATRAKSMVVFGRPCDEAEKQFYEKLRLLHLRRLLGDSGRH
jgi:hypothetical protein